MKKSPLFLTLLSTSLLVTNGLHGLGSMSIGYESRHIYRGVDSALDGSIQWSAIQVEQAGVYGGLWYGTGAATEYEEVDLYGGYVYQAGDWRLIPNFIWYHFPDNDSADSTDVQLWIERDWVLESGIALSPQLKASYNLDVEGTYLEAGILVSFPLEGPWSLSMRPALAWSSDLRPEDGLDHAEIITRLTYALTERLSIQGFLGYSESLEAVDPITDNEAWGGVTVSVQF
jgi:hypothetical protein